MCQLYPIVEPLPDNGLVQMKAFAKNKENLTTV